MHHVPNWSHLPPRPAPFLLAVSMALSTPEATCHLWCCTPTTSSQLSFLFQVLFKPICLFIATASILCLDTVFSCLGYCGSIQTSSPVLPASSPFSTLRPGELSKMPQEPLIDPTCSVGGESKKLWSSLICQVAHCPHLYKEDSGSTCLILILRIKWVTVYKRLRMVLSI